MKQTAGQNTSKREVIVFGAGNIGKTSALMLQYTGVTVTAFFDNSPDKWGEKLFGNIFCERPIVAEHDVLVLIAVENSRIRKEIRKQCEKLGYQDIQDVDVEQLWKAVNNLPDEEYLKLQYFLRIGEELDLKNPKTFNAKLQWLKLYDRNPLYTGMTDKVEAKKYVAKTIGKQYIIPTLGIWDTFEDIDFVSLPEQFVLKCTHDSGSASVILNKNRIDYAYLQAKYKNAIHTNHYMVGREWVYRDIKPRIIAEKYIGNANRYKGELVDYKLMCFNGRVRCSFTCTERLAGEGGLKVTFYDINWKKMPFERHYPSDKEDVPKPVSYDEMVRLAECLAKDIPFARIDFYEVDGHPYFGEITLYPGSGFEEFKPCEWDERLGEWLELPTQKKGTN